MEARCSGFSTLSNGCAYNSQLDQVPPIPKPSRSFKSISQVGPSRLPHCRTDLTLPRTKPSEITFLQVSALLLSILTTALVDLFVKNLQATPQVVPLTRCLSRYAWFIDIPVAGVVISGGNIAVQMSPPTPTVLKSLGFWYLCIGTEKLIHTTFSRPPGYSTFPILSTPPAGVVLPVLSPALSVPGQHADPFAESRVTEYQDFVRRSCKCSSSRTFTITLQPRAGHHIPVHHKQ